MALGEVALGEAELGMGPLGEEGSGEGRVGAAGDGAGAMVGGGAGQPPVWRSVLLLRQLRGTTILITMDTTDPASNNNGRGADGRGSTYVNRQKLAPVPCRLNDKACRARRYRDAVIPTRLCQRISIMLKRDRVGMRVEFAHKSGAS